MLEKNSKRVSFSTSKKLLDQPKRPLSKEESIILKITSIDKKNLNVVRVIIFQDILYILTKLKIMCLVIMTIITIRAKRWIQLIWDYPFNCEI